MVELEHNRVVLTADATPFAQEELVDDARRPSPLTGIVQAIASYVPGPVQAVVAYGGLPGTSLTARMPLADGLVLERKALARLKAPAPSALPLRLQHAKF